MHLASALQHVESERANAGGTVAPSTCGAHSFPSGYLGADR